MKFGLPPTHPRPRLPAPEDRPLRPRFLLFIFVFSYICICISVYLYIIPFSFISMSIFFCLIIFISVSISNSTFRFCTYFHFRFRQRLHHHIYFHFPVSPSCLFLRLFILSGISTEHPYFPPLFEYKRTTIQNEIFPHARSVGVQRVKYFCNIGTPACKLA